MFKRFTLWRQRAYLKMMWAAAHDLADCHNVNFGELDYILARYSEAGRHYHGLDHLEYGLRFIASYCIRQKVYRQDVALLIFAYFYHDLIMHFTRKDNEEQSAKLLCDYMVASGFMPDHDTKRMQNLIMGTRNHQDPKGMDDLPMADPLWPIMNDADLLIFSAPKHIYDRYAENVWKEYSAIYDRPTFESGRRKFLVAFRANNIFRTELAITAAPNIAVSNITRELDQLVAH